MAEQIADVGKALALVHGQVINRLGLMFQQLCHRKGMAGRFLTHIEVDQEEAEGCADGRIKSFSSPLATIPSPWPCSDSLMV